jgi:putative transposase
MDELKRDELELPWRFTLCPEEKLMPKFALPQSDKLTDRSTFDFTIAVLEHYFDLSAEGTLCQTSDLWRVLVQAAARRTTIETVCMDLEQVPDSNTVRGYLKDQLTVTAIRGLQRDCNRALASQLPAWLRDTPRDIAIDLHDEPYYGQAAPDDPNCWVCRGEARAGTTRFYRCATAYVMHRDVRFTLAVVFVHPKNDLRWIVQQLCRRVQTMQIPVKGWFLDKGFCSIPLLRWFDTEFQAPALIAAPIRGKTGGLRALCHGRRGYRTTHTLHSADYGELTVPVAVIRTFRRHRDGSRAAEWLVYVLIRLPDLRLRQVRKRYRRRFGIESSYRLLEQVRGRTTVRYPALRFLWMAIALILGNIWIALHWRYLRRRGSGPRRVARWHFTLTQLAQFLRRAIEHIYGAISIIDPPDVKPAVL